MMSKFIEKFLRIYYSRFLHKYAKCNGTITVLGKVNLINKNVEFGPGVILYPNVSFEGNGKITIGENVKIGTNCILTSSANGGIIIGNDTIIAGNTYIIDSNHGISKGILIQKQCLQSSKVTVGNDVWIGANVTVIKGATILDGAVIGANSLVNSTVPENAVAVGSPAKVIKFRG